jgi:hypothetical protein
MTVLITDPTTAYTDPTVEGAGAATVQEYRTATAIAKGEALKLTVSGTAPDILFTVAQSTAATDNVIGVAQHAVTGTTADPKPIKVVVAGPAMAQTADADIDSGDWVSPTTSGRYTTAATATIANANAKTLGYTLEATVASEATAGDLKWIWVQPSLIAVT